MNYEPHPLCTLFPRMDGTEFAALVADIRENGQREPIILHDGMILDGGNRYRACIEAGVEPQFMQFGGGNLVTYVLSANLHRRHMTPGQQAAIVASAQDWAQAQTHGGDRKADQRDRVPLDTVAARAAISGASEKTQKRADKVAKADPELAKKVAHGEVSLPAAVEQITGKRPGAKPQIEAPPVVDSAPDDADRPAALTEADKLRIENQELRERLSDMADDLSTHVVVEAGSAAIDAELKRLQQQLRVTESQRDEYMRTCAELRKEVKALRRRLGEAA